MKKQKPVVKGKATIKKPVGLEENLNKLKEDYPGGMVPASKISELFRSLKESEKKLGKER
jgi:hypothetical protein